MPDTTFAATAAQPIPGRWKALAVLAAGLSLIILDGTIVGVALPTMLYMALTPSGSTPYTTSSSLLSCSEPAVSATGSGVAPPSQLAWSCSSEDPCWPQRRRDLAPSSPRVPSRVWEARSCCRPPCHQ